MNKELFAQVLSFIKADPQSWNQKRWHCESAHCFAGHVELLTLGEATKNTAGIARAALAISHAQADYLFDPARSLQDFDQIDEHPLFTDDVDALEGFSRNDNRHVRRDVADNPVCPKSILEILSNDKDWTIRRAVAENLNCPTSILEILGKDQVSYVRRAVADNPNCPAGVLELLREDADYDVRESALSNPN
jgi:hypothetical protein